MRRSIPTFFRLDIPADGSSRSWSSLPLRGSVGSKSSWATPLVANCSSATISDDITISKHSNRNRQSILWDGLVEKGLEAIDLKLCTNVNHWPVSCNGVEGGGDRKKVGTLNPKVLLELFSMYRDWQEEKARKITQSQEEIENKIEVVDALAVKLLQRFNYSVSAMKTTAHHLAEVQPLQVEVGELKGRLTEVISNCDALCKRIVTEGPESLRSSVKPFSESISGLESEHNSSSLTTNLIRNSSTINPS
ncbi:hypothetical protein FRX31_018601 [Thalictrum thalictroides]|uniref:Uncharacterized protein n=1 Tax=Thalictrum thalictroides TaxID=46969 RepID=A0A7J6W5J4_THATH|nr:hypothetical protein FRX31_018601 [Thalictrum thalictroides]